MMKKVIIQLSLLFLGASVFAQSHVLHNNSTAVLITPDAISSSHISGDPSSNTNLSVGKNALPLAPLTTLQNRFNTAVGHQTLLMNASGSYNVALGYNSLSSLNDGNRNIGIGVNALQNNNVGSANIGIGNNALKSNVVTFNNVAIGDDAMLNVNNGDGNTVALGKSAMASRTIVQNSLAIGSNALGTTGLYSINNIAIGHNVMLKDNTYSYSDPGRASNNVVVGIDNLKNSVSNYNNSVFGSFSLINSLSTYSNATFGTNILNSTSSSSNYNTLFGNNVMQYSSGNGNVVIGYSAASSYSAFNNLLIMDNSSTTSPLIGGDFSANKVGINRLYTSVSTDANTFQVQGKLGISDQLNFGLDGNSGFSFIKNTGTAGAGGNMQFSTNATIRMEINDVGILKLTNVPVGSAGLTSGQVYQTAGGQLMIMP